MEHPGDEYFGPLAGIDHVAIVNQVLAAMGDNPTQYVSDQYDSQKTSSRRIFVSYDKIAHLTVGESATDMRSAARFKTGIVLALSSLESLARELSVSVDEFYEQWERAAIISLPDEESPRYHALSDGEKREDVKNHILELGLGALDILPEAYASIPELVLNKTDIDMRYDDYVRAGYGCVMKYGWDTLSYIAAGGPKTDEEYDEAIQELVKNDGQIRTHEEAATELTDMLTERGSNVQEVIGCIVAERIAEDEKAVETLNALALMLYGKAEESLALGSISEAFFVAANTGMHIGEALARSRGEDAILCRHRWSKERFHQLLLNEVPFQKIHIERDAIRKMTLLRKKATLPGAYDDLIEFISGSMRYDDSERQAFQDGLFYGIVTYEQAVDAIRNDRIGIQAKYALSNLDNRVDAFLGKNDLTGALQNLVTLYEANCIALGIDSSNITEAEVDTLLELLRDDYHNLGLQDEDIIINGPCFVVELPTSPTENDGADKILIEDGGILTGTVYGLTIGRTPVDKEYIKEEVVSSDQLKLRTTLAFALEDVMVSLNSGETETFDNGVIVGVSVPGSRYRRAQNPRND